MIGIKNKTIGPVCRGTQESFFLRGGSPTPPPRSNPLPYSRTSTNGHFFLPPRWPLRRGSTTGVPSPSLPADVLWSSFVTHSFLPNGRPWGRNECVTNKAQRTSAGRLPKLTLRVCNVNLLSHAAVGVASQATVQTYISMGNKILRFANAKYHSFLLFFL